MGQSPISKMLRHLFLEMFGLSLTAPLSANERIAEFLDFAIQAKFAYVNKLKRAEPVFPLRQSPQCVKLLLTRAIFRAFPSVKKHALRRVGVSFLFFVFPLFSIYSLS